MSNNEIITTDKEIVAYHEYITYLKENPNNIEGLYDVIDTLGWPQQEFFDSLINYINKNIVKPRYALAFDEILETIICNNDKNIYMSLRKQGISPDELHLNLGKYLTYFRPDINYTNRYLPKILEILRNYTDYLKLIVEKDRTLKEKTAYTANHIMDFLNSPYSLERFFMPRKISSTEFIRRYANPLKHNNPELYNKLEENIMIKKEVKKATIKNDVLLILNLIKELGADFTCIDLFKNTLFSPKELVKAADGFLNPEDLRLFRTRINRYGSGDFMGSILGELRIKNFINSQFAITINGELYETSEQEREIVINDLKDYCIPVTSETIMDDFKKLKKEKHLIK